MTPKNKVAMRAVALSVCLVIGYWSLVIKANAFTFMSPSYTIDWGNFNITSGKKTSPNYNLTDTVGQNAPGAYNSTGYVVKSGFQYIYEASYNFSFAIDTLTINLGTLVPGVGSTAIANLTISSPSGQGYQILTAENHPLQINTTNAIPDVTGDTGTATESNAAPWTSATAYGFGFNATGDGTASYFTNPTYFRQFANAAIGETPKIFMSENTPQHDRTARITFKSLISATQAAGRYENDITFIAVPKY